MPDTLDILSKMSKLRKDKIKEIWEQVKVNSALLDSCSKHNFELMKDRKDRRYKCTNCNGELDTVNVIWYNKGLEHGTKQ